MAHIQRSFPRGRELFLVPGVILYGTRQQPFGFFELAWTIFIERNIPIGSVLEIFDFESRRQNNSHY